MSSPNPMVICSWCQAVIFDGTLPASHSMCPRCEDQKRKEWGLSNVPVVPPPFFRRIPGGNYPEIKLFKEIMNAEDAHLDDPELQHDRKLDRDLEAMEQDEMREDERRGK